MKFAKTNFISITKYYLYEEGVFTTKQDEHHQYITKVLSETHEEISDNMNHLYNFFKSDGPNVQKLWHKFCDDVDEQILQALQQAVRASLQQLSLTLNGDSKRSSANFWR